MHEYKGPKAKVMSIHPRPMGSLLLYQVTLVGHDRSQFAQRPGHVARPQLRQHEARDGPLAAAHHKALCIQGRIFVHDNFDSLGSLTSFGIRYCYNVNGDLEIVELSKAKGISKLVATGVRYALDGNKRMLMKNLKAGFETLTEGGGKGNITFATLEGVIL